MSRAPQHAALPERGPTRRLPRWGLGGLADAAKETPDLLEVGQQSHELHAPAAARTLKNVGKFRGSDGSECDYNPDGSLDPGPESFNYCPDPLTPCHVLIDVLPHWLFGPGFGGPPYSYP